MHRRNTSNALIAPVRRKQMRFQRALEVVYGYIWSPRQVKKNFKNPKIRTFWDFSFFLNYLFFLKSASAALVRRLGQWAPSPWPFSPKSLLTSLHTCAKAADSAKFLLLNKRRIMPSHTPPMLVVTNVADRNFCLGPVNQNTPSGRVLGGWTSLTYVTFFFFFLVSIYQQYEISLTMSEKLWITRRRIMMKFEVSWLTQIGTHCWLVALRSAGLASKEFCMN